MEDAGELGYLHFRHIAYLFASKDTWTAFAASLDPENLPSHQNLGSLYLAAWC